jgi:hypothetical protein
MTYQVNNRFQSVPFKRNLQRYTEVPPPRFGVLLGGPLAGLPLSPPRFADKAPVADSQ